ncbi:MAG: DNA topoisomerase III [Terrimicrobiaceae bacterium]|nr:DNA topoisomerase III [Terrimicrobiaceae bacterium]
MGKTLVIAEKPSVASDLARVLGKLAKKDEFFENDEWVVTSAIGHLVELCLPGEMDKKRGKWSFANLPIIPDAFDLKPIEKSESRFKLLKRLLKRPDIDGVVNACDAGREGELIFHYIMQLSGCNKPTNRLWLQSMTPDAIRTGFAKLRDGAEMKPLADAAVCRSESDWLVGINGTRAMTAFNSKGGGFQLTPVGRVQTPTLAILAEREEKIRAFKSRPYFEVHAAFGVEAGGYRGRWFDAKFKKGADEQERAERIWDRSLAEAIEAKCTGKPGFIEEEKKPASQASPLLYDLTTLQREANGRFSFSARRTLQLAQALYEKHKVLTYPRTDSRCLPEDNLNEVKARFTKFEDPSLAVHAQKALKEGWVRPNKRIFNDAKVSDHHAIVPTGVAPKNLDEYEQKLYDMVARRFIAVFYPPAQFEVTTRITRVEGEAFKTDGKIITDPGWLAVYGKQAAGEGEDNVVAVRPGESATTDAIEIKATETKPPARYNEATLLSAMEGAGKLLEDEELRDAMSQRGLGTPATRAQIIEGLILDGYLVRQGREIIVTSKGLSLITLLRGIGVDSLTSPEMTGDWEFQLKQMEAGKIDRAAFMAGIRKFTEEIVDKAKNYSGDAGSVGGNFLDLAAKCPKCGAADFKESFKAYECKGCGLLVWKTMAGRELEREEVKTLLEAGSVGPLEGFRSKMGRPFSAVVKLDADHKQTFDFGDADSKGAAPDFSQAPIIGACPVCKKGQVHDVGAAYVCDQTPACKFRTGKIILQKEISAEQVKKLLDTGKTDLLPKFISKKGRPFSAYLKLEGGKVGFEFEPRKAAPKKVPAAKSPIAEAA